MWRQNISIVTDDLQPERVGVSCTKINRCVCKTWQKARIFWWKTVFAIAQNATPKARNICPKKLIVLIVRPRATRWEVIASVRRRIVNRYVTLKVEPINCRKTDWETKSEANQCQGRTNNKNIVKMFSKHENANNPSIHDSFWARNHVNK